MTAYDSTLSALRGHLCELEAALALWASRDDTKAQSEVRQGAIRASDDATAVRAAELLARVRQLRQKEGR